MMKRSVANYKQIQVLFFCNQYGCINQRMKFLQLQIAVMICNEAIADIAIIWLQQLKVANIAAIS